VTVVQVIFLEEELEVSPDFFSCPVVKLYGPWENMENPRNRW
jgi:hypothetical protein